ncbi:MAG: PadR family transcriptional regulator [Actinomycetia bacterium]|nr:PadR family transcriptional regulator [Actinomycetes bacterium]
MSDLHEHPAVRKFVKELNSGTVSLVLLTILERSAKPLYGYEIAKRIKQGVKEAFPVKRGTLYPVLRSMEEKKLLESQVEPSVSGPPRRYYSITDEGRKVLIVWKQLWQRTFEFVDATLEGDVG